MERVAEQGFTLAGPYYNYAWQGFEFIHQAAEQGLKFTYQLRNHPALNGVSIADRGAVIASLTDAEIAGYVREQVEAVIDDPVANATVARWSIVPEEIRYWSADDLRYLRIAVETLRQVETERGVASRPVWNYQANNRTAEHLILTGAGLDIITKGTYLTTRFDRGTERSGYAVWTFDQILGAAAALGATPQAVFQLYEDFTDPLTGTDAAEIERVIRHDVYLALVKGIKSLNVFSMFEDRPNLTTHNEQFEAYGSIANDLTGELDLDRVFLFGERRDDLDIRPVGVPATFSYTDSAGTSYEYPTVHAANFAIGGDRYVVLVNSTESAMQVSIDGLPSSYIADDLFAGTSQSHTGPVYTTTLDRLGVKVLKLRSGS